MSVTVDQVREVIVHELVLARKKAVDPKTQGYVAGLEEAVRLIDKTVLETEQARGVAAEQFPPGTPAQLSHILSVVRLRDAGYSRREATSDVASQWRIGYNTVSSEYTRGLGLDSTATFDSVIAEVGRRRLLDILSRKFPGHDELIRLHLGMKERVQEKRQSPPN
jgi:hypothetical protein